MYVNWIEIRDSYFGWMFKKRTLFGKICQMKLIWEEILKLRSKSLQLQYTYVFFEIVTSAWGACKLKSYLDCDCITCYYIATNVIFWSHSGWLYNRSLLNFYPNSFFLHHQNSNITVKVVLFALFVFWMQLSEVNLTCCWNIKVYFKTQWDT